MAVRDVFKFDPKLYEKDEPESTWLELRMADLVHLPYDELAALYDDKFNSFDQQEHMIVAFVLDEKVITHTRLAEVLPDIHPRDLSEYLKKLTSKGFLEAHGKTRAVVYQIPGAQHLAPEDVFSAKVSSSSTHLASSSTHLDLSSTYLDSSSTHLGMSSTHLDSSPEHLDQSSTHLDDKQQDEFGRWLIDKLDVPVIGA